MTDTDRSDYFWSEGPEPHATRRVQILAKYPQIKELMGPDWRLFPAVVLEVVLAVGMAIAVRDVSWGWWLLAAYAWNGTISHSLSLAVHELSHNLCFETGAFNMMLATLANCAQGLPSAPTFKKYHLEHHARQGWDDIDVDIPTPSEAKIMHSTLGKLFFVILQPFFYSIRPLICKPKKMLLSELACAVVVFASDIYLGKTFGWSVPGYLILSSLLGLGPHPISGHFIAEHYTLTKDQETYSYYGPLNYLTFNVGYHNEHHDFPRVPGFRLPQVKAIAPEFYDNLPHHDSWVKVMWDYITDPRMGPYNRVKRNRITEDAASKDD